MATKNYQEYAAQVQGCNTLFEQETQRIADECTKVMGNLYYSPQGKQMKKREHMDALTASAENMTGVFRTACTHFCNDFRVVLPDDGADHSGDIDRAMRTLDMLGFGLDAANLKNMLAPMRGSFRSMKVIADLMEAKNRNGSAAGMGFDPEIMRQLYSYMGIDTAVNDYLDMFANVEELTQPNGVGYGFTVLSPDTATNVQINPVVPYAFLACAGWMQQIATKYAALEDQFAALFKNHVPTDAELIESTLRGQG